MIIIELFQNGNASIVSPSRIFQGTDTEKIVVLSPYPYNVPLQVALVKPDETRTDYFPMNLVTDPEVQSEYVAKGVSVWEYLPTVSWTANFGQAFVSVLALLPAESNGQRHKTSFPASMFIEESALPELPSTPDADVYETILDYLANYGERIGKIETDLGTAQGDITDLENGLTQAQEDIEDIDGRVRDIARAYVSGVKGAAEAVYRHGNVNITKANIGLGNVDNTSDMDKPVSTPQQQAISQSFSDALSGAENYTDRHTFGLEYRDLSVITTDTNPTIEEVVQAMSNRSRFIGSVEEKGNLLPSTALGHGIEEITKIASDNATLRYQEYAEPYWSSLENTPFGIAQISKAVKDGDHIYAYSARKQTFARFNTKSRSWSVEYDELRKTTSTGLWFCAYNNVVHYMTFGANGLDALCALDFTTGTSSVVATITNGSIQGQFIERVTDMVEDDRYIYFGGKGIDSLGYFFLYNKATQAFSLHGGSIGVSAGVKLAQDSDYVYYTNQNDLYVFSKTLLALSYHKEIVSIGDVDKNLTNLVYQPINWGDKIVLYASNFDSTYLSGSNVNKLFFFDKTSREIVSSTLPLNPRYGYDYHPLVAIDNDNFYLRMYAYDEIIYYGNNFEIIDNSAFIHWEDIGNPFGENVDITLSMIAYDGFVSIMGNRGYFSTYRNFQSAALWVGTYTADGWSGWYSVTGGNGGSGSGGSGNTTVYVGGEPQREVNFSSDPQTQINNKSFNRVYKSILEAVPNADETLEMKDLISAMYDGSVLVASPKYTSQNNEELTFSNVIPSGASGVNGVVEIEKVDYNHVTARYTENSQWLVSGTINADERLIKSIQENGSIYQVFDDTENSVLLLRVFDEATKKTRSITTSVSTSGIEFVNAVKIDNAVFVVGRVNTNDVTLVKIDISSEPIAHTTYTPPIYSWTNSSSVHAIPMVHFPNDYRLYIFGGHSQLVYFNLNTSRFGTAVNIGVGQDGVSETGDISAVVGMYSKNVSSDSTKRFLIFADGFISVSYLDGELMDKQSNSDNYTCVSDEVVGLDNFGGTERWIFAISAKKNNTRSLYAISYFVDNSGNYSIGQDRARSFSSTSPIVADANTYMTRLLPEDESVNGADSASTVNFYASDGNNLFKFKLSMQSEIIDKPNGLEISDVSILSDGIFIQSTDTGYIEYLNSGSLSAFVGSLINGAFQWENVSYELPSSGSNPNLLINSNFAINQRGESSYTGIANAYTVDRWLKRSTNDTVTVLSNGIRFTNSGSQFPWITQPLDPTINNSLLGKTLTLSGKFNAVSISSGATIRVFVGNGNAGNASGGFNFGYFDVTRAGTFSGKVTIPSSITNTYLNIIISINGTSVNGDYYEIEYLKLEVGDFATAYTPPLIAEELPKCQRYYQKINNRVLFGVSWSAGYISVNYFHIVEMRTIPTLIILSPVTMRTSGVNYTQTSATSNASYRSPIGGVAVLSTFPTNTPANGAFYVSQTNEDVIAFDAEIY